jgi:hypothetical protein
VYWKWPHVAPLSLLAGGLLIEQWTYMIGSRSGPFTDRLTLFRTPARGVILLPVEGLLIVGLLVWVMQGALKGSLTLPRGMVARALVLFWCFVIIGFGVGLSAGGKFNLALWEIRPWLLLSCTYILATASLATRQRLSGVLWVIVLGTGFKGIQGTIIFLTFARRLNPRPESILSHDESLFFGMYILLTMALWLYGQRGKLTFVATLLLPAVVIADLANARRTAWGILLFGAAVLLLAAWVGLPERRRLVGTVFGIVAIAGAVYLPLFWNHGYGTIGQPARAVRSQISSKPDQRDASSDLYRKVEDANLILNIKQGGLIGKGFGRPIDYAIPIADISKYDSTISYIPHNGLLWIWMRLGLQGEIALWLLIGSGLITAGRVARSSDRFIALFGALAACAIVGYVLIGYEDQGFASLRIAPVMGCILGALEAIRRMAPDPAARVLRVVGSGREQNSMQPVPPQTI